MIDRGPQGRLHVPRYSKRGCYYGDAGHCCALCYLRLWWFVLTGRVQ